MLEHRAMPSRIEPSPASPRHAAFGLDMGAGSTGLALRRPALLALVYGTVAAMASTGHVDARLLASTTVCWSWVPALQVLIVWACVAGAPRREMSVPAAIDAFFTTSLPWAIALLVFAGWSAVRPPMSRSMFLALFSIPALWTPWLIRRFFEHELHDSRRAAIARTAAHQAASWLLYLAYYGTAVALWPRVIGWIRQGSITL
jgi:hypothetical protein